MMVMGTFVATVSAEGGNVRYSYEEARIAGDRQFVLVPRAEDNLSGEVTTDRLEAAFEALRSAKRPTYGNSYAVASGNPPRGARVEVHIDSDKTDFAPIIMAEAVYTLTEFGVPEVHFPGHTSGGLTRADISFAAYTLTAPLWKVVPPGSVTTAQILMPDGELLPVAEVNERWQSDRESVVDDVYAFLDTEEPYTLRSIVRILPDVDELRLDDVLPLLAHDERMIRRSTLRILEGMEDDETVLDAVSTALDGESSSSLARRFAEFLGESRHAEYSVLEQFHLLDQGDDEEAEQAVRDLADWEGDPRVVEALSESLRDERSEVAMAAVRSVDELELNEVRADALEDASVAPDVRQEISENLAVSENDPEIRLIGLTYIANERSGGYANQAIAAIGELPIDTAREQVEEFLQNSSTERRRTAIDALIERNSLDSVQSLMEAADDQPETQMMQQAAYDIMVSHSLDEIIEQTGSGSVQVQEVAYRAIGERASQEGERDRSVATINEGRAHRLASIRGAAARSLGQIGGDEALQTLGEMTGDSDAEVRREVALALGGFSGTDYADELMEYLDDNDPGVVAAAIDAMEQRDDRRAADRIQDMVDHDEPVIRASAIRAVTTFLPKDQDDAVRRHMGLLSGSVSDDALEVRKATLEQLGRFESSMAVTNIATQLGAEDTDVRIAAVRALAATGHDDALPLLRSSLGDAEALVRREAVDALTVLAGSNARPQLEERMENEDDPEVRELIQSRLQEI